MIPTTTADQRHWHQRGSTD